MITTTAAIVGVIAAGRSARLGVPPKPSGESPEPRLRSAGKVDGLLENALQVRPLRLSHDPGATFDAAPERRFVMAVQPTSDARREAGVDLGAADQLAAVPRWIQRTPGGLLCTGVALVFFTFATASDVADVTILDAALMYLVLTLVVSALWGYTVGITCAVVSDLCVNYFFVPPLYTFTVADRANVAALLLFLFTALIGAYALSRSRSEGAQARRREEEMRLLRGVNDAVLHTADPGEALSVFCVAVTKALQIRGCTLVSTKTWSSMASSTGPSDAEMTVDDRTEAVAAANTGNITGSAARFHLWPGQPGSLGWTTSLFMPFPPVAREPGVLWLLGTRPGFHRQMQAVLRSLAIDAALTVERAAIAHRAVMAEEIQQANEASWNLIRSAALQDASPSVAAIAKAVTGLRRALADRNVEEAEPYLQGIENETRRLAEFAASIPLMTHVGGTAQAGPNAPTPGADPLPQ